VGTEKDWDWTRAMTTGLIITLRKWIQTSKLVYDTNWKIRFRSPVVKHRITKPIIKPTSTIINTKMQESIESNSTNILVIKWKPFEKLFKSKTTPEASKP